ncbi:MAG: PAS domain S-box protein [Bacteroidia bacterium]|nr:PAS domain S-box protein [Bacteroidia bacterium]
MQTRYQSIFETSIDGIILITDRGVIEDINKSALDFSGMKKMS